jgi:three-Cys-motif partner protein
MENLMLPEDDGLPIRVFGPWTTVKLDYLRRYMYMFETSMRDRPWRHRNYIDLFAGSGKYREEKGGVVLLGSALLALTTEYPFTNLYLADTSEENVAALKSRCQTSPSVVKQYLGNANQVVDFIVSDISNVDSKRMPGKWSSLNLAFLDPDGLELEWSTVTKLASLYTMDLIIYYSQYGLNINLKNSYQAKGETVIDRFFGNLEWRRIYEKWKMKSSMAGIYRELMDYYKDNLDKLGYVDVLEEDPGLEPLMRNTKQAPLYRLVFASKHKRGNDFWREVTKRDVYGQGRLL